MCANALEWKSLPLRPVISYSTVIVEWWAHQTTAYAEQLCFRHTHSTLAHEAVLKRGSRRVSPHHQLGLRGSPVLPLHSHPLSSCTSKRQCVCYVWGLAFLAITIRSTTLLSLYANAAYVHVVNYFFPSGCAFNRGESIFLWGKWGILWHVAEEGTSVLPVLLPLTSLPPQQAHPSLLQCYSVWNHDLHYCPWPKEIAVTGNKRLKSRNNQTVCKSQLINHEMARNIINVYQQSFVSGKPNLILWSDYRSGW